MNKPNLEFDVVAKIESVGSITNNMAEVKQKANEIKEWYANLLISEEDVKDMKKEKAVINKLKDAVATYRKNIVAEFKKPILDFENTAKETERTLKEAYDSIDSQISVFEQQKRQEMIDELKAYFDEYKAVCHLEWLEYERMNQNVTISGSIKKLRVEITDFLNLVASHIRAISIQPEDMQADLLVEYKRSLNFTQALTAVTERRKALEEEKARQEALKAFKAKEEEAVKKVEEVITPVEIKQKPAPKIHTVVLKISGTADQLKDLKKFMEKEGIVYDTNTADTAK